MTTDAVVPRYTAAPVLLLGAVDALVGDSLAAKEKAPRLTGLDKWGPNWG